MELILVDVDTYLRGIGVKKLRYNNVFVSMCAWVSSLGDVLYTLDNGCLLVLYEVGTVNKAKTEDDPDGYIEVEIKADNIMEWNDSNGCAPPMIAFDYLVRGRDGMAGAWYSGSVRYQNFLENATAVVRETDTCLGSGNTEIDRRYRSFCLSNVHTVASKEARFGDFIDYINCGWSLLSRKEPCFFFDGNNNEYDAIPDEFYARNFPKNILFYDDMLLDFTLFRTYDNEHFLMLRAGHGQHEALLYVPL